jgi:hypothetical protein
MRVAKILFSVVALLVAAVAAASDSQPPQDLEIKSTYLPDDCSVKAKKGDKIEVHYVRKPLLQSNGPSSRYLS